jgi:hypothetical protein
MSRASSQRRSKSGPSEPNKIKKRKSRHGLHAGGGGWGVRGKFKLQNIKRRILSRRKGKLPVRVLAELPAEYLDLLDSYRSAWEVLDKASK